MLNMRRPSLRVKKPLGQQQGIKIPEAPVVPTSNMRLPRPVAQTGTSGPPAGAQTMYNGGPIQPGLSGAPGSKLPVPGGPLAGKVNSGRFDPGGSTLKDVKLPTGPGAMTGVGENVREEGGVISNDDLANQAIRDLIGQGPRDTSEDEALIQQLLQSTVGQGQEDLNARMAAGGMGTSGALGALSGDMRANAARGAAGEIMGVRQGARDEYLDRVMAGIEAEFKDRGLDMSEEQYTQWLDTVNQMYGEDEAAQSEADKAKAPTEDHEAKAEYSTQQPWGSSFAGEDDEYTYYRTIWGQIAKVPKDGKVRD